MKIGKIAEKSKLPVKIFVETIGEAEVREYIRLLRQEPSEVIATGLRKPDSFLIKMLDYNERFQGDYYIDFNTKTPDGQVDLIKPKNGSRLQRRLKNSALANEIKLNLVLPFDAHLLNSFLRYNVGLVAWISDSPEKVGEKGYITLNRKDFWGNDLGNLRHVSYSSIENTLKECAKKNRYDEFWKMHMDRLPSGYKKYPIEGGN